MKTFIKKIIVLVVISLFIEICFFNFNAIRSHFYSTYQDELNIYYDSAFEYNNYVYELSYDTEYSTIEIYDINEEINNIYIDFDIEGTTKIANTYIYLSDEGNIDLYSNEYGKGMIWNQNSSSSHYATINSYGKTNTILIKIYKSSDSILKINNIKLNCIRPVFFSLYRFFFIFILTTLIAIFLYDRKVNNYTFKNTNSLIHRVVISIIIVFQIATSLIISNINLYLNNDYENSQYQLLTDSLLKGEVNLDIEVNENLLKLDNPYDLTQRIDNNCDENFDHAYYKGKFYCYFGIAPVITFYLPYKILTGSHISDSLINTITFIILSISIITLFYKIIRKYYENTPISIFILITLFAINSSGALTLLAEPRIYTVPILYGLALSMAALSFWINSIKDNGKLNNVFVCLGSIAMGLAIASRPQFALFSLFAIVIFFEFIKDIKNNFKSFTIGIIPLLIIGISLMYYNYIRFESPFDFGANYNLTFNDMTKRGFKFDRIGDGLFFYLLQPMNISSLFPYINQVKFETNYIGMLIHEYSFGGLFAINPFAISSLFSIKIKSWFTNKKLYISSIMLAVFGIIIVILDTQMAGLVERYFGDFSIFFILASVLVILTIINSNINNKMLIYKLIFILVMIALTYSTLRLFADNYMTLETCNPNLYYKIYCLTQF